MSGEWPLALEGLTESVVSTQNEAARWDVAALGLEPGESVTARTWGQTRTRQNFEREGAGVIQFTTDPVTFVEAALAVKTIDDPVVASADAWVKISVERRESGTTNGTEWVEWALEPVGTTVERRTVPSIRRGFNAVIEATVDASRLDVGAFDAAELRSRIDHHRSIVDRCGSPRDREAMARLDELISR